MKPKENTRVMDTQVLAKLLHDAGCNPRSYSIGSDRGASDAFCLVRHGPQWRVFYTERGQAEPPEYVSKDEDQACRYFLQLILELPHNHCVGFFRSQARADQLYAELHAAGLNPTQDRIPYGGPDDPRFRVFVSGPAIFGARELLGTLPREDA